MLIYIDYIMLKCIFIRNAAGCYTIATIYSCGCKPPFDCNLYAPINLCLEVLDN